MLLLDESIEVMGLKICLDASITVDGHDIKSTSRRDAARISITIEILVILCTVDSEWIRLHQNRSAHSDMSDQVRFIDCEVFFRSRETEGSIHSPILAVHVVKFIATRVSPVFRIPSDPVFPFRATLQWTWTNGLSPRFPRVCVLASLV
jgi:hypothetical protein